MSRLWNALATVIEAVAKAGAGAASAGLTYEPELPSELK